MPLTGKCMCAAVSYTLRGEPLFAHNCHCSDCQRSTGSAFAHLVVVDRQELEVSGETRSTHLPTPSGAGCDAYFCPSCATVLWCNYRVIHDDVVALRGGSLDDPNAAPPRAHIFARSKQEWLDLSEDLPTYDEFYDLPSMWPAEAFARFKEIMARG